MRSVRERAATAGSEANPAEVGQVSFNLIDEPWILVVRSDGSLGTCSIREVLLSAHEIAEITGELPTQVPPIIRLLLAVLARALEGPADLDEWEELWKEPRLPAERIDAYLDRWRERFDLFHPVHPFMQVPLDPEDRKKAKTAALLLPHLPSGNNVPLFYPQLDDRPPKLTPAEAARWLLHCHAWDTAAIKTGRTHDPAAKAGKTTGNPVGTLGNTGVLVPLGHTLRETLLLNLAARQEPQDEDLPVWERPPLDVTWSVRAPAGVADLFTWASRRVTLIPAVQPSGEASVCEVVVSAGDRFDRADLFGIEAHCSWRLQRGKAGEPPRYLPRLHAIERRTWQGMGSLLASRSPDLLARDLPEDVAPLALQWIATLRDSGVEGLPQLIEVFACGAKYGSQQAVVEELFDDRLPLPVKALSATDPSVAELLKSCVGDVQSVEKLLGSLAVGIYKSAGGRDENQEKAARAAVVERFLHLVDREFRSLLASVAVENDLVAQRAGWQRALHRLATQVAEEALAEAPPSAYVGRDINGAHVNAWVVERAFRRGLARELPLVEPGSEPAPSTGDAAGEPVMESASAQLSGPSAQEHA